MHSEPLSLIYGKKGKGNEQDQNVFLWRVNIFTEVMRKKCLEVTG